LYVLFSGTHHIFHVAEVEAENDSPDNTPKKEDKPVKEEVTKVTRPQGRLV
jgi:hypothetical protein